MIVCLRTVAVPAAERARYLASINAARAAKEAHGILAEWVLEPSSAAPERDRLTAWDLHQAVDYQPITHYEIADGYTNLTALTALADRFGQTPKEDAP